LVLSFDDLTKLGSQIGYRLDESVTESAPDALRLLRCLHDRGIGGSESAVVTLGKRGCIVVDWRRNSEERIDLEYREEVATKNGAGDRFLGAWVFFRVAWLSPPKAAVQATLKAAAFHDLTDDQYVLNINAV
jgi:sugar/nucleoside kinase (ribokinase family)